MASSEETQFMLSMLRNVTLAAVVAFSAGPAKAQSYPVDCAILLCLPGGWPASAPCAAAKREFIRRITPWPIEPPLQIWRCPMGGSAQLQDMRAQSPWLDSSAIKDGPALRPIPAEPEVSTAVPAMLRNLGDGGATPDQLLRFVQGYTGGGSADIDISSTTFDYVRSIRVYSVERLRQWERGRDANCTRYESIRIGTYDEQGSFSWHGGDAEDLPQAFVGDERWGDHCPAVSVRAVFVDWRDYQGRYGFEQVNY